MPSSAGLTGRAQEIKQLVSWLQAIAPDGQPVLVVEGEAGIGKSSLLAVASAVARDEGPVVLVGRCDDLDHTRPFAALIDAIGTDPLLALPEKMVVDATYVATEAFVDAIEAKAVEAPLVLAVDDLHWADPPTLVVLRELRTRLADLPFGLVVLLRPGSRPEALERFLDSLDEAERIELGPLPATDVERLARTMLGAPPGDSLQAELARAAGNPLYVQELVAALDADRQLEQRNGRVELVNPAMPAGLRHAVLRRLADLKPSTVDALRSAALLGKSFATPDLAVVTHRDLGGLALELIDAVKAGVLVDSGAELSFRHDLVREAIEADLPQSVRLSMHLAIGLELDRAGAPANRVAPHLLLGASLGGADAVAALERTALALQRVSPGLSVELLDVALDMVPDGSAQYDALLGPTIRLMILEGQLSDAETRIRAALGRPHEPALNRLLRHGLHTCLERSGRLEQWRTELEGMLAGDQIGEAERSDLEASLAFSRLLTGNAGSARTLAEQARARGAAAGETYAEIGAELTLAWVGLAEGHPHEGLEHARRAAALEVARSAPNQDYALPVDLQLGVALLDADEVSEGLAVFRRGLRRAIDRGDPSGATTHQWGLCAAEYLRADWESSLVEAESGLRAVDDGHGTELGLLLAYGVMARALCRLGRVDEAESRVRDGEALLARIGPGFGADWLLWGAAAVAAARGDHDRALSTLALAWDATAGVRYFLLWRHLAPELVRLSVAAGDRPRAEAVTAAAEEGARRAVGVVSAEAAGLYCRAVLDDNAELLAHAIEVAGGGQRSVLAIEFGADQPVAAMRPASGWAALTPAEVRVVDAVAEGLTNGQAAAKLFVSRYTVETHLKKVFAKLGVTNRYELIATATRR